VGSRETRPSLITNTTFDLFEIDDPFGLRRAIFPILEMRQDGTSNGLGTGFFLDPWNRIISAQHVVEKGVHNDRKGIVALLSYGIALGSVRIPNGAFAQIESTVALSSIEDDPLAQLRGKEKSHDFDLALGKLLGTHDARLASNLPIHAHLFNRVKVGDHVVALGFPDITLKQDEPNGSTIISRDILMAARGIVVEEHSLGRGKSQPAPVFEVECNWPSGMSGGPVFNERGEVVGVVSRSIEAASGERAGRGWATWLEVFPNVLNLLPTLDGLNPNDRRCWGGFEDGDLIETVDLSVSHEVLCQRRSSLDWKRITWRLGTDEYGLE
jgi:serine protease Do